MLMQYQLPSADLSTQLCLEWIQIVQLIEDIESSIDGSNKNYFLGNLIVNQTDNNVYEVIDGSND